MDPLATQLPDVLAAAGELGPYRLLKSLGRGGMAEVFLAVHRHLGHVRAVKVLLPGVSDGRVLAMRLITEARAMARLRHPAIVEVFECDTLPSDSAFIVMEYLRGEPVGEWLRRTTSLAAHPRLAAALIGVVADALAYAHEHGIIHRDIKPDNLFLIPDATDRRRFRVKVLDFGIAKLLREKPLITTRIGSVVGTPFYMAPEGWENGATIDQRTDIYSLGCVFFELLSGRTPFVAEDSYQMMRAHLLQSPPPITSIEASVPPELERLIARMLSKDPAQRPETMEQVLVALELFLDRKRSQFAELLEAPEELCIGSGHGVQAEATSLGLGWPVENTTPSLVGELANTQRINRFSARELRMIAGGALLFLLVGGASIGTALMREPPKKVHAGASAVPVAPPAPRPVLPPPVPPAPPAPPAAVADPPPLASPVPVEAPPPVAPRLRVRRPKAAPPAAPAAPATAAPPTVPAQRPLNQYLPVED